MKKFLSLLLPLTMGFTLAACGNSGSAPSSSPASVEDSTSLESASQTEGSSAAESTAAETEADSHSLIVYFSWSGNTESVANEIQAQTGADIFEIIPAEPYTDDYDTLLDLAQEEQAGNARPAIAETVPNFEQYDVVYLGYPIWWGDMPMILYTFLDGYEFAGKTIAPFVTSGGSGFSGTIGTIESMEPDAAVTDGLSLGSSAAGDPADAVSEWLGSIANVTFEPGCRNNWHIHQARKGGGQILLCTAGRGWYQEWGREARELFPGDAVEIPAGIKHWHGAAKDSWFSHLAVEVPGEETSTEWLEPVSDEEYDKQK